MILDCFEENTEFYKKVTPLLVSIILLFLTSRMVSKVMKYKCLCKPSNIDEYILNLFSFIKLGDSTRTKNLQNQLILNSSITSLTAANSS